LAKIIYLTFNYFKYYISIIVCLFLLSGQTTYGQPYSSKDLPVLTSDFFKGSKPEGSPYAANIYIRIDYRYISTEEVSDNKILLKFKINVWPDSTKSHFPKSGLSKEQIDGLLKHEFGHIIIGFIIGNDIQNRLAGFTYTRNYPNEVRHNFNLLLNELNLLHEQYDNATSHGANKSSQELWDKKLFEMLDGIK
jgi:hypothetical protein